MKPSNLRIRIWWLLIVPVVFALGIRLCSIPLSTWYGFRDVKIRIIVHDGASHSAVKGAIVSLRRDTPDAPSTPSGTTGDDGSFTALCELRTYGRNTLCGQETFVSLTVTDWEITVSADNYNSVTCNLSSLFSEERLKITSNQFDVPISLTKAR